MCLYRSGCWFKKRNLHFLSSVCQRIMHHLCHCWISVSAKIGPGFLISHVGGIIIGSGTVIGKNCDIRHNTTFGGNFHKCRVDGSTHPIVGNNVSFGVGAAILGPVVIGDNAIIGANSVVTHDVFENTIVGPIPARFIRKRWDEKKEGRNL